MHGAPGFQIPLGPAEMLLRNPSETRPRAPQGFPQTSQTSPAVPRWSQGTPNLPETHQRPAIDVPDNPTTQPYNHPKDTIIYPSSCLGSRARAICCDFTTKQKQKGGGGEWPGFALSKTSKQTGGGGGHGPRFEFKAIGGESWALFLVKCWPKVAKIGSFGPHWDPKLGQSWTKSRSMFTQT